MTKAAEKLLNVACGVEHTVQRVRTLDEPKHASLKGGSYMKSVAILAFVLGVTASAADAATMVTFTGNATGDLSTGTAWITLDGRGNSITGTLTNTSPSDARITYFLFDRGTRSLASFIVRPDPVTMPSGVILHFRNDVLGNVPQFKSVVLHFDYVTGTNAI